MDNGKKSFNKRMEKNMKVRDLLTVLRTDSVILTRGQEILVDCETSHIEQKLEKYKLRMKA